MARARLGRPGSGPWVLHARMGRSATLSQPLMPGSGTQCGSQISSCGETHGPDDTVPGVRCSLQARGRVVSISTWLRRHESPTPQQQSASTCAVSVTARLLLAATAQQCSCRGSCPVTLHCCSKELRRGSSLLRRHSISWRRAR